MGAPAATGCLPGSDPCRRTRRLPQNSGRKRKEKRGEKGERKRGGKELSAIAQQKTAALCSAKGAGGGFGQPAPALDWLKGGNMRERKFIMAGRRKVYLTVLEEYFLDGVLDCGNRDGFKCGKPACEKGGEEREPGDGGGGVGGVGGKASYPAVMRYSAGYTLAQDFFIVAENQENAADPQKSRWTIRQRSRTFRNLTCGAIRGRFRLCRGNTGRLCGWFA